MSNITSQLYMGEMKVIAEIKSTDLETLFSSIKHLALNGYQVLITHDAIFYKAVIVKPKVDKSMFELSDWNFL